MSTDGRQSAGLHTGRTPTMSDVAERAGVSRQLVSLVLRNAPGPSEASREKVLAAAADLDFHPHASARLLRQNRTMLVGVCLAIGNPFQNACVQLLYDTLRRHGYHATLAPKSLERGDEVVIAELMEQRVEALVTFNPDPDSPALHRALAKVPVVWLGERDPLGRCDNVHVDERQGLRQVVEHLTALGHRHITYCGGLQGVVGPDRRAAYESAMHQAGLARHIDVIEGGFEEEDGARAARTLLQHPAGPTTALVCSSDQCAAGAVAAFARRGVDVPGQMSVVGFDDGHVAALSYNDLTSVRQDVATSVEATTRLLMARLSGDDSAPHRVLVPTTLTHRSSVGPPRRGPLSPAG